jgi:hypothetical protein
MADLDPAGVEAAMRAFDDAAMGGFDSLRDEQWPEYAMRQAIGAYLARVSPSRDGSVAVEDVVAFIDREQGERGDLDPGTVDVLMKRIRAEFSPASTGDRPLSE